MDACCTLGDILHKPDEILLETDNLFVTPTIGCMGIPGYLLILSKECFKGMGSLPEHLHPELEEVIVHTHTVLKQVYNKDIQMFEHGPKVCDFRGGSCLDHAHLHIVPGVDFMEALALDLMYRIDDDGKFYRVDRQDGLKRAMDVMQNGTTSYFLAQFPDARRIFVEVNFHIPSQYMRRLIAEECGTQEWDWKVHGHFETYEKTLETLHGQF